MFCSSFSFQYYFSKMIISDKIFHISRNHFWILGHHCISCVHLRKLRCLRRLLMSSLTILLSSFLKLFTSMISRHVKGTLANYFKHCLQSSNELKWMNYLGSVTVRDIVSNEHSASWNIIRFLNHLFTRNCFK